MQNIWISALWPPHGCHDLSFAECHSLNQSRMQILFKWYNLYFSFLFQKKNTRTKRQNENRTPLHSLLALFIRLGYSILPFFISFLSLFLSFLLYFFAYVHTQHSSFESFTTFSILYWTFRIIFFFWLFGLFVSRTAFVHFKYPHMHTHETAEKKIMYTVIVECVLQM